MTRKSICLLFLVLLALPCFAASKYESKITSLEGEMVGRCSRLGIEDAF